MCLPKRNILNMLETVKYALFGWNRRFLSNIIIFFNKTNFVNN